MRWKDGVGMVTRLLVLLAVQIIIKMELEELIGKINELEIENGELKQSLDQAGQKLREERELWNQEHAQLMMEIQLLKEEVAKLQDSIEEIHQRNLELQAENQHVCYEMTSLQKAYQSAKVPSKHHDSIHQPQEPSQQYSQNHHNIEQYSIPTSLHYQYTQQQTTKDMFKSVPLIKSQSMIPCSAHMEDNEYDLKVFLVEDCQPHDPSYRQDSINGQRHSLRGSLRALNMIDNFSAAGKEHSEHSSVFTSKYFKYQEQNPHLSEKAQHQSRLHIPQQPQLENLMTQRNIDSQQDQPPAIPIWWQRASCFLSGTCLGLYLFWQLGHE